MHRRRRSYTFGRTAGAGCSRPSAPTRQTQHGCSLQHSCNRTEMASATRRSGDKGAAAHVFTARATACMTLPNDAWVFVCSGRYVSAGSTNHRHAVRGHYLLVELGANSSGCRFCGSATLLPVRELQTLSHCTQRTIHTEHARAKEALTCACSAWISAAAASSRVFECLAADSASCLPRTACWTAAAAAAAERCNSCSMAFFCTSSSKTCTGVSAR